MGYFNKIKEASEVFDNFGTAYLDTLPFIETHEVCERIWKWAWSAVDKTKQGEPVFNGKNELAEEILEGCYLQFPENGSLGFALSSSPTAFDANIRSLLEFVEGRQKSWVKFKFCLTKDELCSTFFDLA